MAKMHIFVYAITLFMRLRVGVFFGGSSREREVSFAGGRTVYDLLDRALFTPIPFFITPHHRCIRLQWAHLYKGSIGDFFCGKEAGDYIEDERPLIANIGEEVSWDRLGDALDIAFVVLHGAGGEDGSIQGLLAWHGVVYTGASIGASALSLDKGFQRAWMHKAGFHLPRGGHSQKRMGKCKRRGPSRDERGV